MSKFVARLAEKAFVARQAGRCAIPTTVEMPVKQTVRQLLNSNQPGVAIIYGALSTGRKTRIGEAIRKAGTHRCILADAHNWSSWDGDLLDATQTKHLDELASWETKLVMVCPADLVEAGWYRAMCLASIAKQHVKPVVVCQPDQAFEFIKHISYTELAGQVVCCASTPAARQEMMHKLAHHYNSSGMPSLNEKLIEEPTKFVLA
jgi:hypothetical protein